MGKLEKAQELSKAVANSPDEAEILEMRLNLLNQQEMNRLKSNDELIKTLRALHTAIKDSTSNVQRAAHEVRAYPVEVISQATARMEQCLNRCEMSATKAQQVYDEALKMVSEVNKYYWQWIICVALVSPMVMAALLFFIMLRWK